MWLRPHELSVKIKLFFRLSGDEEQRCHGIHRGSSLSGVFLTGLEPVCISQPRISAPVS